MSLECISVSLCQTYLGHLSGETLLGEENPAKSERIDELERFSSYFEVALRARPSPVVVAIGGTPIFQRRLHRSQFALLNPRFGHSKALHGGW